MGSKILLAKSDFVFCLSYERTLTLLNPHYHRKQSTHFVIPSLWQVSIQNTGNGDYQIQSIKTKFACICYTIKAKIIALKILTMA